MKTKNLLLIPVMLLVSMLTADAQNPSPIRHSVKDIIPFGKKLPAPEFANYPGKLTLASSDINEAIRTGTTLPDPNTLKKEPGLYRQRLLNLRKIQQLPEGNNG